MKKLIFFLALLANPAFAEEWWEANTQAGGRIILTKQTADWCPKGFLIGYIETTKQDAIYGCWTYVNSRIHMKFNDGNIKIYDLDGWVMYRDWETDRKSTRLNSSH